MFGALAALLATLAAACGAAAAAAAPEAAGQLPVCSGEVPVVRSIPSLVADSYGRPGWSHVMLAGAMAHGMREVKVIVVLTGSGQVLVLDKASGKVQSHDVASNSTIVLANTGTTDMQSIVAISQPPMKVYVHPAWDTPGAEAIYTFPAFRDKRCPDDSAKEKLLSDKSELYIAPAEHKAATTLLALQHRWQQCRWHFSQIQE
eukprot:SM000079S22454  [mRNA]  locus=s79:256851:258068:- [translate_table: standard]